MSNESFERASLSERTDGTVDHGQSSTSPGKKGTNRGSNIFLMNKHPELFDISPRPGGYLRHLAKIKNSSGSGVDKNGDKPNESASVATDLSTSGEADFGRILETSIRCPIAHVSKSEKKDNTVRMCSIAISTVMMLAQHIYEDITSEHVKHTEEYFRGLKQADGYPRNVGQLVKLLSNLKKSGRIGTSYDDEDVEAFAEKQDDENSAMRMNDLIDQ